MSARKPQQGWQIAECLLPGLTLPGAEELARRIATELAGEPRPGVCFLGSLLMPGDEVLPCLFTGPAAAVAKLSRRTSTTRTPRYDPEREERQCDSTATRGRARVRSGSYRRLPSR